MNEALWNEYNIKRLSPERLNDLTILYQAVHGGKPRHQYFERKYETFFTGVSYTGYLAYDAHNKPAAFFGAIPCFIHYKEEKILAAQAVDAITHPLHRNKGLFVTLANFTMELCRDEGVRILFGFPNQYSLPGLVGKLQWHLTGYMYFFIFPVKTLPLEQLASKLPLLKGIYNWYVAHHFNKHKLPQKDVVQSLSGSGFAHIYRDDDYVKYKNYNQAIMIKIQGKDLWLKVSNGLVVGDMAMPADFEDMIHNLKRLARKLGLTQIMFQVSEGTAIYNLLKKFTQPQRGFPVIIKDMGSGLPTDKLKFTFADIDIF